MCVFNKLPIGSLDLLLAGLTHLGGLRQVLKATRSRLREFILPRYHHHVLFVMAARRHYGSCSGTRSSWCVHIWRSRHCRAGLGGEAFMLAVALVTGWSVWELCEDKHES